jgi:truncated hemoglobin YjbI
LPEETIIDEAVLPTLLAAFYGGVRRDDLLGPVFNNPVHDWAHAG